MTRGPKAKYPWTKWFAYTPRKLTLIKGKHFNCEPHGMAQQIRNKAAQYRVIVSIRIEKQFLTVKITEK